jgi:hypothetical protein
MDVMYVVVVMVGVMVGVVMVMWMGDGKWEIDPDGDELEAEEVVVCGTLTLQMFGLARRRRIRKITTSSHRGWLTIA